MALAEGRQQPHRLAAVFDPQMDLGRVAAPTEQAVLAYAEDLALPVKADDSTINALAEHPDDREIVELTMTIAFYNPVARLLVALQVDLE